MRILTIIFLLISLSVYSQRTRPLSSTKFIDDANLVSYWQMSDANDYKNANNGTGSNMSYSAGKFSNAGSFNGSSSKITLTDNASLRPSSAFTISAWFKKSSGTDAYMIFNNFTGGAFYGYQFYVLGHNLRIWVKSTSEIASSGGSTVDDNVWHHGVATWDGSNLRLYVDGKLDATPTACTSISYTTTMYPVIGMQYVSSVYYPFNGSLDDIALFSRALSSTEVQELYQGMTAGEYIPNSSTAGYWRLNGNSMDYSSNANNGTDANITYGTAYGRFGQGASFNGTSSKITLPDNASLKPTGNFTISAWIKSSSTSSGDNEAIFSSWRYASGLSQGIRFMLYEGQLYGDIYAGSGAFIYDDVVIRNGLWHNCVMVYDGTTIKLYRNGIEVKTVDNTINAQYNALNTTMIGAEISNGTYGYFDGSIDEVILESRAWSAQEIRNYYTQSKGRFVNN